MRAGLLTVTGAVLALTATIPPASAATASSTEPVAAECRPSKIQRLDALVGGHRFAKFVDTRVGRVGMAVWDKANALGGRLTGAIARKLNADERRQADAASTIAVCQGIAGREIRWISTSRTGVSGTSTVTALESDARLGRCITVRDIVIVDGLETRTAKRLCRAPGASGYRLAA